MKVLLGALLSTLQHTTVTLPGRDRNVECGPYCTDRCFLSIYDVILDRWLLSSRDPKDIAS
jgi:hypothetical protein